MDSGPGFSAWSKIALGWLEPDEVPAEPPNILVVNLQPLEEHSGSRAVVVELTLTELYVVEVRRRIGYDSALPAEGVLVYMIDLKQKAGYGVVKVVDANSETPTLDDATYGKGDFFEDRKNDFYVLVADTDGVGFTVCVSRTKVQSLKDSDHDGLLDAVEAQYGTDPGNPDSDGDGLQDGEEIAHYHTNPLEADSDADGLKDGDEVLKYKTEPLNPDSDGDGLSDGDEALKYRTNPAAADSDYDGVEDSEEIRLGSDPLKVDTDNDGLLDGNEIKHGTNPLRSDTDADFWPDGVDFAPTNSLMPNGIFLVLVALALVSVIAYQRGAFAFVSGRPNVPVRLPRGATCLRCGVANRLGSSFCRRCGTPLRTGVGLVCPLCATANRPTATFCRRCRFKLRRS
jgi:ribosomal protein L40E